MRINLLLIISSIILFSCSESAKPTSSALPTASAESSISKEISDKIISDYKTWAVAQSSLFLKLNIEFTDALNSKNFEKAKLLYAKARQPFERIEPIAEALGEFDPWLDAREGDTKLEEWKGFHAIEKILWLTKDYQALPKLSKALLDDIKLLRAQIETSDISLKGMIAGAGELLAEISTGKLTGEEERYSHTDLYDIEANFEGSLFIVTLCKDLITKKDEKLMNTLETLSKDYINFLESLKVKGEFKIFTELKPEDIKTLTKLTDAFAVSVSQIAKILE